MSATTIQISSGNNQYQGIALELGSPLIVFVSDSAGVGVSGVDVVFKIETNKLKLWQ